VIDMAIWIHNSLINGGSYTDMMARKLTTVWGVFLQDEPIPGKETLPWNPHEVDFNGVGNQLFDLEGHFCEGSAFTADGSVAMQFGLLGSYCNIGSPSWLVYDKFILNGTGSLRVLLSKPKVTNSFKNEDEVDYFVQMVETAEW